MHSTNAGVMSYLYLGRKFRDFFGVTILSMVSDGLSLLVMTSFTISFYE